MKVYIIKHETLQGGMVVWDNLDDAIEEVRMHLTEGEIGDTMIVGVSEISDEDFNSLPEFEGY